MDELVIGLLPQHFAEVRDEVRLRFPVDDRNGGSDWFAVVDAISSLSVGMDVVIVHGCGSPLNVGNSSTGRVAGV